MLKICNVCKSFNHVKVLDDVNVNIERHSIVGLAGSSGSGKSTLLRCIQGLEKPDDGIITCVGKFSFMFQDFQLFPHMTVLQNLIYAPTLKDGVNKKQYIEKAEASLKDLGINEKKMEYPGSLSGGQKQRVALARSLMIDPDVLLCDEPTSGLDVATINDVADLLRRVNKKNVTIVIASHDLDFLVNLCDRIILLKFGKIIVDVCPSQYEDAAAHLKNFYDIPSHREIPNTLA
jgi:polar amino acid transport system ATP-binding protein